VKAVKAIGQYRGAADDCFPVSNWKDDDECVMLSMSGAWCRYGKPDASEFEVMQAAIEANAHEFIVSFPDGYKTYVGER
jgi:ABC-type transport system involved in Fe-S cluster assembly fused permease/ATPase subunit